MPKRANVVMVAEAEDGSRKDGRCWDFRSIKDHAGGSSDACGGQEG